MKFCIKFFFTSVNDRTNCPAIQGFDRTKPVFDRTLSVDRPLFQALAVETSKSFISGMSAHVIMIENVVQMNGRIISVME